MTERDRELVFALRAWTFLPCKFLFSNIIPSNKTRKPNSFTCPVPSPVRRHGKPFCVTSADYSVYTFLGIYAHNFQMINITTLLWFDCCFCCCITAEHFTLPARTFHLMVMIGRKYAQISCLPAKNYISSNIKAPQSFLMKSCKWNKLLKQIMSPLL